MDPNTFSPNAPGSLQHDPGGYWTYHPYALPPLFRWTDRLVTALSRADRAVARLDALCRAKNISGIPLLTSIEAAASCRMAGLDISTAGLCLAEASGAHAPHLLPPAEQAAVSLAGALEALQGLPEPDGIRRMHARIWTGAVDDRWPPGEFRPGQTWIGDAGAGPAGAAFVPPPPDVMRTALESLLDFIRAPAALPDLVRLAMVHYQFGVIYPFYDANARMGRLLVQWALRGWGLLPDACLPLSAWLEPRTQELAGLLDGVSRENAWEDWLVFFLEGVETGAARAGRLLEQLSGVREELLGAVEKERNAERLGRVVQLLIENPCLTVGQVEQALSSGNFKSAARVVDRLTEKGILVEVTGQARHRVFTAPAVLNFLEA